ncbi:acetyl-CoA synthetase [Kribbella sp. VKM Ac-2527]|uniref:Acetyl-CoA synthetase n=1 Tax=Kribbella caucasensis TaxID=2512215 RepID=A0A4R6K4P6_9ACTN|nr:AMP-binding protein [Kribbella sp. VKM Ac-2527]TDO44343.1 acetyl-CoA synthetase [Kribbella sp. VKM Ac-2527]
MSEEQSTSDNTRTFREARDFLIAHREDYETAYRDFNWPVFDRFNWARDWFDALAVEQPEVPALTIVEEDGEVNSLTYAEMAERSRQVAGWLNQAGLQPGDRVLIVLGNTVPLWETMLACIRAGAVMIPATTLLTDADLADRIERGGVRAVVTSSAEAGRYEGIADYCLRVAVGDRVDGWLHYDDSAQYDGPVPDVETAAHDSLLLYFTSGTTSQPKLVEHTQVSYPVGHLSTLYWIGLQPGDVHLNVSSPGWAKHSWSNVFAPWNAGATAFLYNYARFDAEKMLRVLQTYGVTTFCAPPTVWRMLIQADLTAVDVQIRECISAGEPLNPEVIEQVLNAWGVTIRDGYGQTETTAQIGNPPGQPVKLGSMGRPLPGYSIALVDPGTGEVGDDGEICIELAPPPVPLMRGYRDAKDLTDEAMRGGFYHTGDVASRDEDGYITYVGRADDVFKASDYRISPFELESVLIEHPAVAEAAVVPSPDPVRLAVPKAYVVLVAGREPSRELADEILSYCREHLAPYKRIRRIEFAELPKTISGKIRRVELRTDEAAKVDRGERAEHAYDESDFRPG